MRSLSLRRAWIEIAFRVFQSKECCSRSPYGERGLKSEGLDTGSEMVSRSPYGERGLKLHPRIQRGRSGQSLSLRRAWIEILRRGRLRRLRLSRSPYGERGLKSIEIVCGWIAFESLSLRRAWIEMMRG